MIKRHIAVGFLAIGLFGSVAAEENLAFLRPIPKVSWAERQSYLIQGTNSFVLTKGPADPLVRVSLLSAFFPAFTAAEKVRVSFSYRGGSGRMALVANLSPMEKVETDIPLFTEAPFYPSADWKRFSHEIVLPADDFMNHSLDVVVRDGTGVLEVRDVRIEEIAPSRTAGRPFLVGGSPVEEIAILASEDPLRFENEFRAARMFRYVLYRNGGSYLPVRIVRDIASIGPRAVLIGAAAVSTGIVSARDEEDHQGRDVRQCFDGGCVRRTKGTRLGIVGGFPTGPQYGVYRLFRTLGIEYLGAGFWRSPKGSDALVAPEGDEDFTPAVAFRLSHYNYRGGTMPELRGRTTFEKLMCDFSVGVPGNARIGVDHSMAKAIVSPREFWKTRPDFFSVDEKGNRQPVGTSPQYVQYCLSNPDLAKLVGERMIELMRANPAALLFPISPGDGSGKDCKCARCRALASTSDVWMTFYNRVAEVTSKEFQWKYLHLSSYVDTPRAPVSGLRPHPNVTGDYCIYPRPYWPSCLWWDHWSNDEGRAALASWRKILPRIALIYYPMQCSEWMNVWPSFDMDVALVRDFARARAHYTRYFGLAPVHGGNLPQMGGFVDLRLHVLGCLEEDPETDVEPVIDGFMRDFYGPAAEPMRQYFNLLRGESARREWIENCELRRRGFVTPELGEKGLALLDAAERLATDPAVRRRFLREKEIFLWSYLSDVSLGRGNVPADGKKAWFGRVGEFCRIVRETGVSHMGGVDVGRWFYNLAFTTFPPGSNLRNWSLLPEVKEIAVAPESTLAKLVANGQVRTNDAVYVFATGLAGGQPCRCDRKGALSPRACTVRRASSGHGVVSTFFTLKEEETRCRRLVICGNWNGHAASSRMTVSINGKTVFDGASPFSGGGWKDFPIAVPDGMLKSGRNLIVIRNLTGDDIGKMGREAMLAAQNYYWGWIDIEHLRLEK